MMAPSTLSWRAPVADGTVLARPCTLKNPMSANRHASFASSGTPKSSIKEIATPGSRRRSPAIRTGLRVPPPAAKSSVTPYASTARATVSTVSSAKRGEKIVGRDRTSAHFFAQVRLVKVLLAGRLRRRQLVIRIVQELCEERWIDRAASGSLAVAVEDLGAARLPGDCRVHQRVRRADVEGDRGACLGPTTVMLEIPPRFSEPRTCGGFFPSKSTSRRLASGAPCPPAAMSRLRTS